MTTRALASASFCVLLSLGTASTFAGQAPTGSLSAAPPQSAGGGTTDLSSQATDPTAFLLTFNFIGDTRTSFHGLDDNGFEFEFQSIVPYRIWGTSNILRTIVPYQAAGPGNEGLKSVALADLVVRPAKWGRWGVGPVISLEQSDSGAASKFLFGPAVGAVVPLSKKLLVGVFNQNLFATAVGITQIQPIIAYQLGQGWALSAGDLQITYDWEQGQWVQLPVGFQIGVVRPIAGQPFRFSVNPQWNLKNITGAVESRVIFTVALLVPGR
jgi:hypothetical protein